MEGKSRAPLASSVLVGPGRGRCRCRSTGFHSPTTGGARVVATPHTPQRRSVAFVAPFTLSVVVCLSFLSVFPPMAAASPTLTTDLDSTAVRNVAPATSLYRTILVRDPSKRESCPCQIPLTQCVVSPDVLRLHPVLPLRSVDRSFRASDSKWHWPRTIELTVEVRSEELALNAFLFTSGSFVFDWLPSAHDIVNPPFDQPTFVRTHFSTEPNTNRPKAMLTFLFPESVVLMRSSYRLRINALQHMHCGQNVSFLQSVKTEILFACEHTENYDCFGAIPPYSPFCVTAENVSASLVDRKNGKDALLEVRLNRLPLGNGPQPNPDLQFAALYGPCSLSLQNFGFHLAVKLTKDQCQLKVDAIWRQNICATPFENCRNTRVVQIANVVANVQYGLLFCAFHNAVPFPHNKTMLRQLAVAKQVELPFNVLQRTYTSLQTEGEVGAFLVYGGILVLMFGLFFIMLIQKRRQRKPLAANMLQFLQADEWELNEPDVFIHFVHKVGSGSTADVFRGKLSKDFRTPAAGPVVLDESQQVAVKVMKKNCSEDQKAEFMAEMEICKLIGRNNRIVNLIGVMQLRRPPLIVFEFCVNGDLRRCLHKCRQYAWELESKGFHLAEMDDINSIPQVNENFVFTFKRIVRLAIQICLGMEFLASQQLIHGDLSTRNVFLTSKHSIKIGDFGLCRKESDVSKLYSCILTDNRSRWAAPEILQRNFQCLASDVWSFGVVLYELMTLGAIPYHTVCNSSDLVQMLNDGHRLGKSTYCSDKLYSIMMSCWAETPSDRPSFPALTMRLTELYDSVDTKDNKTNFYVIPDPQRELYMLPLSKTDSPAITNTPTATDSPLPLAAMQNGSGSPLVTRPNKSMRKNLTTRTSQSPEKEELIHETERLLGFS